jgi:hypothetical protein
MLPSNNIQRRQIFKWIAHIVALSTIFYSRKRIYIFLLGLIPRIKPTIKDTSTPPPIVEEEEIDPKQAALKYKSRIDDLVLKTLAIHDSIPDKIHSTSEKGTKVSSSLTTKRGERSVEYDLPQLIATIRLSNYDARLVEARTLKQVDSDTSISYKLQKGK